MVQLFISYSSMDRDVALQIASILEESGYTVWIDQKNILGGARWATAIVDAIVSCNVFILLITENSISSDNVRKEVDLAAEEKRKIIPLRFTDIQNIPADFRYHLAGVQYINFTNGIDHGISSLLAILDRELGTTQQKEEENFIKINTRTWNSDFGRIILLTYSEMLDVDILLNEIYFSLTPDEPPSFTFGEIWGLRDPATNTVFREMGLGWRRKHGMTGSDERSLKEVGIFPGMTLEVIRFSADIKPKTR